MTNELQLSAQSQAAIARLSIDGRARGANQADLSLSQINAGNDVEAIRAWLDNYRDRSTTYANYRKEAERLLLWALADAIGLSSIPAADLRHFRRFLDDPAPSDRLWALISDVRPLASLAHGDVLRYRKFLEDPKPAATWTTENGARYGTQDPRWRPFAGKLREESIQQAMLVIDSLFGWLVEAGYLRGNPVGLLRKRRRGRLQTRVERYLPQALWDDVLNYIDGMPEDSPESRRSKARARWLTTLFYLLGMRISEVAAGRMVDFTRTIGADRVERWWLDVVGKGLKARRIPASPELIAELMRYRKFHELPPLPQRGEVTPLLILFRRRQKSGEESAVDRKTVHDAIKVIFRGAADWLREQDPTDTWRADEFERTSAHWLRHTAASHMLDRDMDLRAVRDNLGHASINTTNQYLHEADDQRHDETVAAHRMNWKGGS